MKTISRVFTIAFFLVVISAAVLGADKDYKLFKTEDLKDIVSKSLEGTKGDYSIVIQNLKTSESYGLNSHKIYQPGSLYKLWVMAVVYDEIKKGNLKENQVLSATIPQLNREFDIDPQNAEQTEGAVKMTVSQALNQMITISHNYAALLLSSEVENSKISKFLQDYGFSESKLSISSSVENPQTSAYDIEAFYEKLYNGEIVDKESSQKMIELLLKQQLNDRIPKYLPKGTKVAHKTGEIEFYKHDAGIVFAPKGDYIIVVFSESDFPLAASERIANLSKNVYEYFSN